MFIAEGVDKTYVQTYYKDMVCYSGKGVASLPKVVWESPSFNGMKKRFLKIGWKQVGPEQLGRWMK